MRKAYFAVDIFFEGTSGPPSSAHFTLDETPFQRAVKLSRESKGIPAPPAVLRKSRLSLIGARGDEPA